MVGLFGVGVIAISTQIDPGVASPSMHAGISHEVVAVGIGVTEANTVDVGVGLTTITSNGPSLGVFDGSVDCKFEPVGSTHV